MKTLEDISVTDKRILVRIDANVPLSTADKGGRITDDFRLRAVLPTIHYLLNRRARVVLMSHLGRPGGKTDSRLSLRPIFDHLAGLIHQPILFAPKIFSDSTTTAIEGLHQGQLLGLENLRFDPGEDKNSRTFARRLANYGEIYVNDAFSVSHRQSASIVAITEFLPSYAGLLMEKEVKVLSELMRHPAKPYVAIIGGAKIADKLPVMRKLLDHVDWLLVGGGVANTFLAAEGASVKRSLVDSDQISAAKRILHQGKGRIVLPLDYLWHQDKILDIGPKTVELFRSHLDKACTVFWSGPVGLIEDKDYARGSVAMAKTMADLKATTVVGGGNTIELVDKLGLTNRMSFVSTGGGASLEFLSGAHLPGLKVLG
jgi:phosphoglycerate kinase